MRNYSACITPLLVLMMIVSLMSSPKCLMAGGGPENVLVVVNARSWASKTIANEFVRLRQIPPGNVIYLKDVPTHETISVDDFRTKIFQPILQAVAGSGLSKQIDYIVYSSDIPYAVNLRSDIAKLEKKPPRIHTPVGSINGMTYLAGLVMTGNPAYIRLNSNLYTRRIVRANGARNIPAVANRVTPEEQATLAEALKLTRDKKWDEAAKLYVQLLKSHAENASLHYNLACCYARLEKADSAMQSLKSASKTGWSNHAHALRDDDLKNLRKHKDFQAWIVELKKIQFDVQPALGFRSQYQWNSRGERVASGGARYFLSTMLAMTSGRGNSVTEAIRCLQRGKQADASHPTGTIYISKNKNVRSITRQHAFEPTVKKLKAMGVAAEIREGILPKNRADVMGVVIGSASYAWEKSRSTILPGAIVESLTSYGGVMRERAGQTPLSNMIRNGAVGSSGTVTEPFALQAKFPLPFIHVHYATGCSLAEAFYQSVAGPYQLLIVGDPLCQPWAKFPSVTLQELYPGVKMRKNTQLTPLYNGDIADIDHFELFVDGKRTAIAGPKEQIPFEIENLTGGYHELRVVGVKANAIETQGRCIIPIELLKAGQQTLMRVETGREVRWNKPITIHAECDGATELLIMQNSRPLARQQASTAKFQISPLTLGSGTVTISAVGILNGKPCRSKPVTLEIVPPKALPPTENSMPDKAAEGLLLKQGEKQPAVIADTHAAKWLEEQQLAANTEFELTGLFKVTTDEVYQFQLNNNCQSQIFVDGVELKTTHQSGWNYLPVHLQKGVHSFQLKGTTPEKNPRLRVCFGGQGTYSLTGKTFRHLPASKEK